MSGMFKHAIRYEFADRNPITEVRQSGKREKIPVLLEITELHRLFDELELRERAMIVCDALSGIRRSELMGLQWGGPGFHRASHEHCAISGGPGDRKLQDRSVTEARCHE
jgi:integrase